MNHNSNKLCDRVTDCLCNSKSYKKIIHFIHEKIFINYEVLWKILLNYNINLISAAVRHYVNQLNT